MKLVSVHVPKTGGTSLRLALERVHRLATFYRTLNSPEDPQVVHGHIRVSEARRRWPGVPVVAFVRNPFDQIRSNFDHYRRAPQTRFDPGIGRLPPGMTFGDFIAHPPMVDYQSQFVDGPVDFLGTTERLSDGVAEINRLFGLDVPAPARDNVTPRRSRLHERHRTMIRVHHRGDLLLYGKAAG